MTAETQLGWELNQNQGEKEPLLSMRLLECLGTIFFNDFN